MVDASISYDIGGIIVLVIIGIYFIRTNPKRTYRRSAFSHIFITAILAGIMDILRILMLRADFDYGAPWYLINAVYFACISFVTPLFLLYIIGATDTWHLLKKKKYSVFFSVCPVVIGAIVIFISIFRPVIIEINADKTITYRWGYLFVNVLVIFYMLICASYIKMLEKYFGRKKCIVFYVPIYVVAVGLLIQAYLPNHHVIVFTVAINGLLLVLINRRAEGSIDIVTGLFSYRMFAQNMENNLCTEKRMKLILVNIINYENALRLVGYDDMLDIMRPLSNEISRVMSSFRTQYFGYYNGDGKFAFEIAEDACESVAEMADSIIKSINQNMGLVIGDFEIKINACIVNCPTDISDVDSLFMLISDLDKYPSDGKVVSAAAITSTQEFRMKKEMTIILDRAIANHYFSVFYQPIYDVKTKRFASAEALIRLRDPKYGYISPGVFIPLAEKNGAIHNIGSFVIQEVCKFIASEEFKELNLDYIEINLSVMQCLRTDLADEIIATTKKYGVNPKYLNLEITETASAYSQEKLQDNIYALNKAGFTFSLDDFGTGYSNLMRITSMPFSIIKLDRAFVILDEKPGYHAIIQNLVVMLKEMGFKILVEGIETEEMVEEFTNIGVDDIQGFYFSRPLTKSDFIRFIKKNNEVT